MSLKTVSILGCGWLGLPLGIELVRSGFTVKGSTTTPSKVEILASHGIRPYLIHLDPEIKGTSIEDFFESDVLFINIPPPRVATGRHSLFLQQIETIDSFLEKSGCEYVIFASSTSVYPEVNRIVTEEDASPEAGETGAMLLEAEGRLLASTNHETSVLRFAGLYGYERQPGRFLAGRSALPNGDAPVNLIHRDDCIRIIMNLLPGSQRGLILNACSDGHPRRRDFYTREAIHLGLTPPSFLDESTTRFKIVSNERLKRYLDFEFLYPDPLEPSP